MGWPSLWLWTGTTLLRRSSRKLNPKDDNGDGGEDGEQAVDNNGNDDDGGGEDSGEDGHDDDERDHLVASVWSEMNSCQQSRLPAFHPGVLSNILNQLLVNKNNCLNSTQSTRITMSKLCTYTAKGLSNFLYTFSCQIGGSSFVDDEDEVQNYMNVADLNFCILAI